MPAQGSRKERPRPGTLFLAQPRMSAHPEPPRPPPRTTSSTDVCPIKKTERVAFAWPRAGIPLGVGRASRHPTKKCIGQKTGWTPTGSGQELASEPPPGNRSRRRNVSSRLCPKICANWGCLAQPLAPTIASPWGVSSGQPVCTGISITWHDLPPECGRTSPRTTQGRASGGAPIYSHIAPPHRGS